MALDLRHLRPSELARLANSTPLGPVISERHVHRHRVRAGYRIGDGKRLDCWRYAAWLIDMRHGPEESKGGKAGQDYEAKKEAARSRMAAMARSGRDIAPLPAVADKERKVAAEHSFRFFCEQYFPITFHLPWSDDHRRVISKIEQAVTHGGLFATAMPRGSGKALALDTPLPTPDGWTTMGEVRVSDTLFDERGRQCRVTFATPVQRDRPCYQVQFSDGTAITCDADHLWTVHDRHCHRNPLTLRTADMAPRVALPTNRPWVEHRYRIPLTEPLQTVQSNLPIAPYVLGMWLGNGTCATSTITNHSDDAAEFEERARHAGEFLDFRRKKPGALATTGILTPAQRIPCLLPSFQARLRSANLLNNKHIPPAYLRASAPDRLRLLQGLMDTDGHITPKGACELTLKEGQLCTDVAELLTSLGIKFRGKTKWVILDGKRYGPYRRFHFTTYDDRPVFQLARKACRIKKTPKGAAARHRHIIAIEPVPSVPVRCIQVDSPSHLYLAGRGMIPTHNTTLTECACLWSLLHGHREFVALIGSDEGHAANMLESIKTELETNERLLEDFPEVIYPIQRLEGIANRCSGQLCNGKRTMISWTANEIILPTIDGSRASGGIIRVAGITGRIRGMKFKRGDGQTVRPSLVILDDPQTDESARSLSQCTNRERVIAGAVLGLAGPGKKISGIMPCTVIRPGDVADRLLDRQQHPEWNGERTKLVRRFPCNEALWERYAEIRADCLRRSGTIAEATAFYRDHQAAMDAGAEVAWPERFNPDEASAIQHAMNLRLQDPVAFAAEYQNEPLTDDDFDAGQLTADDIAARVNGLPRGRLPLEAQYLTGFIDVQGDLLYWILCAWSEDFSGWVIDYGAEPDQGRPYFTLREASPTLHDRAQGAGQEGAIHAGLTRLCDQLFRHPWKREDGAELALDRLLVDANWGASTEVVYGFCRSSPHGGIIIPSHGRYVGASSLPLAEYKRKKGDRLGFNWRLPSVAGKRAIRHVVYDTNFWKSFVHARLATAQGDRGALTLYGKDPRYHRLLAEHCTAEYWVRTQGRGRTVEEWKLRPQASDNHLWDGLVGCAVGASMAGASLAVCSSKGADMLSKRPLRLSELQRQKRRR